MLQVSIAKSAPASFTPVTAGSSTLEEYRSAWKDLRDAQSRLVITPWLSLSRLLLYSTGLTAVQASAGVKPTCPHFGLRPMHAVVSVRLEEALVVPQHLEERERERVSE